MAYLTNQFSHIMKQLDNGNLEERDCSGTESERNEDLSLDFEDSGEKKSTIPTHFTDLREERRKRNVL